MLAKALIAALGLALISNVAVASPTKSKQNLSAAHAQKPSASKARISAKTAAKPAKSRKAKITKSRKAAATSKGATSRKTVRLAIRQKIATPQNKPTSTAKSSLASEPDVTPTATATGRDRFLSLAASVKPDSLPLTLVDAVITRESRYNPKARGGSGEVGLMQILPSTGRALARQHGHEDVAKMSHGDLVAWLEIPENNIKLGTKYLSMCHEKAKRSVPATIGCYNAGPGNMWAWNSISLTRKYVQFVNQHIAAN